MKTNLKEGTVYLSIASLVFIATGYLINISLGRILGPSLYGIYGVIISLMTAINLTQTAGLPQAIAKFVAEDEKNADGVLKSGLALQVTSTLIASIIFFLFAKPIALLLKDTSLIPYLQLSAVVFPLYGIYSVYLNYYNGLHFFKRQAAMGIGYALIKVIAVLGLVYVFHVYGAILGFIISPLIALFIGIHIPRVKNRFPYKRLIFFSLPLIGVAIFSNLLQSIDLFFVKAILHINMFTGYYTANQNIAEIPFYGVVAIASVLFPSISRHVSRNLVRETKLLIRNSLRITLLILLPSVLLISATSLSILQLLFSSTFSQGAESLAILTIGNFFFTLFIILTTIISGSGSPGKSSILAGIGVILSAIFCILFTPHFGLNGAAWATTVASFFVMIGAGIIVYRKFGVLFDIKSSCKIFIASLVIYGIARVIVLPVMLLPVLYLFLFGIYGGLLFVMKEITEEDVSLIRSLIPKRKN